MYNMERYCTSLYCIENPYWTRRRRVIRTGQYRDTCNILLILYIQSFLNE